MCILTADYSNIVTFNRKVLFISVNRSAYLSVCRILTQYKMVIDKNMAACAVLWTWEMLFYELTLSPRSKGDFKSFQIYYMSQITHCHPTVQPVIKYSQDLKLEHTFSLIKKVPIHDCPFLSKIQVKEDKFYLPTFCVIRSPGSASLSLS